MLLPISKGRTATKKDCSLEDQLSFWSCRVSKPAPKFHEPELKHENLRPRFHKAVCLNKTHIFLAIPLISSTRKQVIYHQINNCHTRQNGKHQPIKTTTIITDDNQIMKGIYHQIKNYSTWRKWNRTPDKDWHIGKNGIYDQVETCNSEKNEYTIRLKVSYKAKME